MSDERETCPRCGSDLVAGLVASFWYPVGDDLNQAKITSNTEMGPERNCGKCGLEYMEGEPYQPEANPVKKPRKRKGS